MILDEPMEMRIVRPVKVSRAGDFFQADTFVFQPPQPRMAKETFRMHRYFSQIQK